jgi:hypothetical protein
MRIHADPDPQHCIACVHLCLPLGAGGTDSICVVMQGVAAVRQEVHALLARKEHQNWNTIIQVLVLHISFYNLKGESLI